MTPHRININFPKIKTEYKKHLRGVPTSPWGAAGGTRNPKDFATGPSLSITWFGVSESDFWTSFELYFRIFQWTNQNLIFGIWGWALGIYLLPQGENELFESPPYFNLSSVGHLEGFQSGQIHDNWHDVAYMKMWTLLKRQTAAAPPKTMLTPKIMK